MSCSRCWRCSSPVCCAATRRSSAPCTVSASTSTRRAPTRGAGVTTPVRDARSSARAEVPKRPVAPRGRRRRHHSRARRGQHRGRRHQPPHAARLPLQRLRLVCSCSGTSSATAGRRGPRRRAPRVREQGRAARRASRASTGSRRIDVPTVMSSTALGRLRRAGRAVLRAHRRRVGRGDRRGRGQRVGAGAVAAAHRARRRRHARPQGQPEGRAPGQARRPTSCAKPAPIATCSPPASAPGDPSLYTLPAGCRRRTTGERAMTDLAAHGIEVTAALRLGRPRVPTARGGRGHRPTAADGPPAPPGETTNAVAARVDDRAAARRWATSPAARSTGSVPTTRSSCCSSTTRQRRPAAVHEQSGIPRALSPDDFSPGVLQRAIRGQAGVQRFFHEPGRAFCLYVVLGSFARRASW